jgi:hypothetical protein
LSPYTILYVHAAIKQFLAYVAIPVSDHAISDLVNYKKKNPLSADIEQAVQDLGAEPPKSHAGLSIDESYDSHPSLTDNPQLWEATESSVLVLAFSNS